MRSILGMMSNLMAVGCGGDLRQQGAMRRCDGKANYSTFTASRGFYIMEHGRSIRSIICAELEHA